MPDNTYDLGRWGYSACPLETDPALFGPFSEFVELWQSRIPEGGRIPPRAGFDFFDFEGWWGRVAISRVEGDPVDVRFVLWGTELTEWWGVDYTNKLLGKTSILPSSWRDAESRYFAGMQKEPFIGLVQGNLTQHDRPHIRVLGIDLPMGGDSQTLDSVLTAHIRVELTDSLSSITPDAPIIKEY